MRLQLLFLSNLIILTISKSDSPVNDLDSATNKPSQSSILPQFTSLFAQDKCHIPPIPDKLAIACITRFRAKTSQDLPQAISFFKQFMNKYAEMQCPIFDNIYFVWNNEKRPEEYEGLFDRKQYWKKNVYFFETTYNALDHRLAFPSWVPEEVFMSLDDDADIDCENIRKSFEQWQQHVVGGVGPFATVQISARVIQYKMNEDRFKYYPWSKSFISMSLPNIGIIHRHFYDLYYAPFPEFKKMRQLVIKWINCDDICLNFMIGYVYPEIKPLALKGITAKNLPFKVEVSKTPQHWQQREDAVNNFTLILGQNTLSYSLIDRNQTQQKAKSDPLRKNQCLLALKRSLIQSKYLSHDHYYTFMKGITIKNVTEIESLRYQKIKQDQYIFSLSLEERKQQNRTGKIDLSYKSRYSFGKTFGQKYEAVQKSNPRLEEKFNNLQKDYESMKVMAFVSLAVLIVLIVGLGCKCVIRSIKRKQNEMKLKQKGYSNQMSSEVSERNENEIN